MTRQRYVVAYDVPDNRRRHRVARHLEAHAERLQKSVFEAVIDPGDMDRCLQVLKGILDPDKDSLAVYRLCRACERSRSYFGQANESIGDEEVFIV